MHVKEDTCVEDNTIRHHMCLVLLWLIRKKMLAWKDGTMFDWDLLQKWRSPLVCFMF